MASAGVSINGSHAQESSSAPPPGERASSSSRDPAEVSWLFVPQYYLLMNQEPHRLHRFYNKKSSFVHGVEQEDAKPCFGQAGINEKIMSLGFNDCKVFVSNVDSQLSADGGIIIQVLGEMSNKDGPWRKFAQTFFLAEQPNGYYVLNDIFRYLKEEEETEQEAAEMDETIDEEMREAEQAGNMVAQQVDVTAALGHPSETAITDETHTTEATQERSQALIGHKTSLRATTASHEPESTTNSAERIVERQRPSGGIPGAENTPSDLEQGHEGLQDGDPDATKTEPITPSHWTAPTNPASQGMAAAQSTPAKAPAPKTWANLAASNASKWSSVASEGRGASAIAKSGANDRPSAVSPLKPTPLAQKAVSGSSSTPIGGAASRGPHRGDDEASVYIKNVNPDRVRTDSLKRSLAQYGTLLNLHTIPTKACAFADFTSAEDAKRAIQASADQGGVIVDGWTVTIEGKRKHDKIGAGAQKGPTAGGGQANPRSGGGSTRPPQRRL